MYLPKRPRPRSETPPQSMVLKARPAPGTGGGGAARLPRWTRQEILVLIQGKKVVESRGRGSRAAAHPGTLQPKWAGVSAYCKRHGVIRGPVQCRKRWSNLAVDFRKIRDWETRLRGNESFWAMKTDARRESKLPGFFHREVYDILNGGRDTDGKSDDALVPNHVDFSAGPTTAADGLFSDPAQSHQQAARCCHEIEGETVRIHSLVSPTTVSGLKEKNLKEQSSKESSEATDRDYPLQGAKRKREEMSSRLLEHLVENFERYAQMLESQMEAQNINLQLDRKEMRENTEKLVGILSKLTDTLGRIVDKM